MSFSDKDEDRFRYKFYDWELYNRFVGNSVLRRLQFPTVRSAYRAGLLTRTVPYEDPQVRIEMIGHGVRLFHIDASSPSTWRYALLSEVKRVFGLRKAEIRSDDGQFVFTSETPIDFFVFNGRNRLIVEALDDNATEAVTMTSTTPSSSYDRFEDSSNNAKYGAMWSSEGESSSNEPTIHLDVDDTVHTNMTVLGKAIEIFFEELLFTTLEQNVLKKLLKRIDFSLRFVVDACKQLYFQNGSEGVTIEQVVERIGTLNFGYLVSLIHQVFKRALLDLSETLHHVDTKLYSEKYLNDYYRKLAKQVSARYVAALRPELGEKSVSVSNEPLVEIDNPNDLQELRYVQTEPLQPYVNTAEDVDMYDVPPENATSSSSQSSEALESPQLDEDDAAYSIEGRRLNKLLSAGKTAISSVSNQLTSSKFVKFSIAGKGKLESLAAEVEPGSIIEMLVAAFKPSTTSKVPKPGDNPQWILIRIAEDKGSRKHIVNKLKQGEEGKTERFCCSWKLRRTATGFSIPFTVPLRRGVYRVHVYVPHSSGISTSWSVEGTAEFRVTSVGKAQGMPIKWKDFDATLAKARDDPDLSWQLYLTKEIQNGRVAGEWPYPSAENNNATTFSIAADAIEEMQNWQAQEGEQQNDALTNRYLAIYINYAPAKRDRIIRAIFCIYHYIRTGSRTFDVSSVTTPIIDKGVHLEEEDVYEDRQSPVEASIFVMGRTYEIDSVNEITSMNEALGPDAYLSAEEKRTGRTHEPLRGIEDFLTQPSLKRPTSKAQQRKSASPLVATATVVQPPPPTSLLGTPLPSLLATTLPSPLKTTLPPPPGKTPPPLLVTPPPPPPGRTPSPPLVTPPPPPPGRTPFLSSGTSPSPEWESLVPSSSFTPPFDATGGFPPLTSVPASDPFIVTTTSPTSPTLSPVSSPTRSPPPSPVSSPTRSPPPSSVSSPMLSSLTSPSLVNGSVFRENTDVEAPNPQRFDPLSASFIPATFQGIPQSVGESTETVDSDSREEEGEDSTPVQANMRSRSAPFVAVTANYQKVEDRIYDDLVYGDGFQETGIYVSVVPTDDHLERITGDTIDFLRTRTTRNPYENSTIAKTGKSFRARVGARQLIVTLRVDDPRSEFFEAVITDANTKMELDAHATVRVHARGLRKMSIIVFTNAPF